jgi:hypothetical protein
MIRALLCITSLFFCRPRLTSPTLLPFKIKFVSQIILVPTIKTMSRIFMTGREAAEARFDIGGHFLIGVSQYLISHDRPNK